MVRTRPHLPAGHGEVLTRPDVSEWPDLVQRNREEASGWDFSIDGVAASSVRAHCRSELLERAAAFSARLGVPVQTPRSPEEPIVATGHQPELYHPGVWVKDFLLERLGTAVGASAVDIVVDTDGFDAIELTAPCLEPEVRRCRQYLAIGAGETCYACAPVPSRSELDAFCDAGAKMVASLPAPAVGRHFGDFCTALRSAAPDAGSLAELVTFARRRYEAPAETTYLEVPVSEIARTEAFCRFVSHLARDAERFQTVYNEELAAYRVATSTRSPAQPFPDLDRRGDGFELPLWHVDDASRRSVWASTGADGAVSLVSDDGPIAALPDDPRAAADAVRDAPGFIAPKAVTLTMFIRLFACDLFIHGVGGARYDRVTDAIVRRYFGVEPPAFAVASMTMYLPLGAHVVTDEEVAEATERLNRFEHNPDQLLGEVEFESADERERAYALVARKEALKREISAPDADKKALGGEIRAVNADLADVLKPVGDELAAEKNRLERQRADSEVFTDRTYPFVFWSPAEVADKVG